MLFLYFYTRFKSLVRLCKELGILACIILSLIFFFFLSIIIKAPEHYTILLFAATGLTWHLSRSDKMFLQTLFGRRHIFIYIAEYLLLSIPFIAIMFSKNSWEGSAVVLVLSFLIPLFPKRYNSLPMPTFPLLLDGSYEYQRMGRMFLPFYLIIFIASTIGVYIYNVNFVFVTNFLIISIIGMFLSIKVNIQYIFNYTDFTHFFRLKCKYAFENTGIIIIPMLLCLFLVNRSWGQLAICISCYINSSLFFLQLELLRFICGSDEIVIFIAYTILFCLFALSTMIPIFTLLSLSIVAVLAYKVRSALKKLLL